MTARLARRLNLTDPQKSALREMTDAFASADASAKQSLCADKPDLSTTPGRMAFAKKMAEIRVAGLTAIEPKLQAFYENAGREAEEGVQHWRAHGRHIQLVGQDISAWPRI